MGTVTAQMTAEETEVLFAHYDQYRKTHDGEKPPADAVSPDGYPLASALQRYEAELTCFEGVEFYGLP